MLHHDPIYLRSLDDDRRRRAARRAAQADPGEIERTVLAAASRSSWAWTTLVERFGSLVRGIARRHGLGPHDVEDVAQTTWLRLYEHIDDVHKPESIGGWLATTARRESLNVLRRGIQERPTDCELVGLEPVEPINEGRLVAAERHSALRSGVERLPGTQRRLIAMMLSEPPPEYAEISRLLGIPTGSIGPTRQRSLARLRRDKMLVALCEDEAPQRARTSM